MDISDGMDKSWDHPWTTEEMRKNRREWSLAGDAGLLKHLQQFSENLSSRADKTQEALDSLTTQLNETAIFIDNVTNTSLALANTQFIESRVQEDDIDIEKKEDTTEKLKDEDSAAADLIASVSESIKQGLNIMYEKYKEMEFIDSDSDEEDNKVVQSVVLGPNNPYQDRPLPYTIGSEKWKTSNRIGLESSSSSESEQVDEEEESESEDDSIAAFKDFSMEAAPKPNIESDYSKRNDIAYMGNEKIDVVSQNNIESIPESVTSNDNLMKVPLSNNLAPNFAEELAKRLGTVGQTQKLSVEEEKSEASFNQYKDDLFSPEEDENVLSDKSNKIFNENKGFLSDHLKKEKKEEPIKSYKNNIIPASIDVPPPISTVSTNPKSAIDDLFADGDSEDSDDFFSSKNTVKTVTKNKYSSNNNHSFNAEDAQKKFLDTIAPVSHIATSTPETNLNSNNLFSDDEDFGDLFGSSKNEPANKKKSVDVPVPGNILTADSENKLSNKISRSQTFGSSGNNTPENYESGATSEPMYDHSRNNISNDNINERNSTEVARNNAENLDVANESSYSSGISIHPSSINNTGGSSIGVDFQPQMTSTRLKSEEIYRERVASDSLFTARTRNATNATLNSNSANNQLQEELIANLSSTRQNDVFENEDLFDPPPLPKASSKLTRSKMPSLFDDSDSGDELFSTTSSGSRSQRSNDFLTNTSQYTDKNKSMQRRGLFDKEIDLYGNKDSPDVDIFGIIPKLTDKDESSVPSRKFLDIPDDDLFASNIRDTVTKSNNTEKSQNAGVSKKIGLFDDDDDDADDNDLFTTRSTKPETKSESHIFSDDEENDLFSVKKLIGGKQKNNKQSVETISSGTDTVDEKVLDEKKEKKNNDILTDNGLFSTTIGSHGFVFEDDDYDDLFGCSQRVTPEKTKEDERLKTEIKEDALKESSIKDTKVLDDSHIFTKPKEPNISANVSNKIGEDIEVSVNKISSPEKRDTIENTKHEPKKSPPKSLDIPSPPSEENNHGTKRAVSGKIKNLMGKMGDLKILSPMDTPPLWRRSEEKTDEEDSIADRDSDDGGCISTQGHSSPLSVSEDSTAQKQSQQSTISGESNVESAISFDEPVQVETLSTTASKTRVRIQAKRRPQSRHARKSAIRQSGINFDTVGTSENNSQDESQANQSSSAFNKEASTAMNVSVAYTTTTNSDRLVSTNGNLHRTSDANNIFLAADDKSELGSISKESSMSANKNTLLSPSTDEEDLFDVPPDLPEDPQKEDTLFGRAPILSPVERVISEKPPVTFKPLKDTYIKQIDDVDASATKPIEKTEKSTILSESSATTNIKNVISHTSQVETKQENVEFKNESKEMIDPLRDSIHDPLKDPSQLFAFVTKTPSPEKGKNLLFSEDDSLFSSGVKKIVEEQIVEKPVLDLFADDVEGDLFSTSLVKPSKKPLKDTKISLFDEDDEDDSLFGPVVKKSSIKSESKKKHSMQQPVKKLSSFDDDENDADLFFDPPEHRQKSDFSSIQEQKNKNDIFASITEPVRTSHITDTFADESSDEDDIFGKKSMSESYIKSTETRSTIKKSVTRDLKKTAEKIAEDPLSALLDD